MPAPLSTICEAMVKLPVLFCWMPRSPPLAPVIMPPVIT
jgi:hypothetical protein